MNSLWGKASKRRVRPSYSDLAENLKIRICDMSFSNSQFEFGAKLKSASDCGHLWRYMVTFSKFWLQKWLLSKEKIQNQNDYSWYNTTTSLLSLCWLVISFNRFVLLSNVSLCFRRKHPLVNLLSKLKRLVARVRFQGHFFNQIVFDRASVQTNGATSTFSVFSWAPSEIYHHHLFGNNFSCFGKMEVLNI